MKKIIAAAAILMTVTFASCWGGDRDNNGREDNRIRNKDGNTSARRDDGSTTSFTPPVNTKVKPRLDSAAIEATPPK